MSFERCPCSGASLSRLLQPAAMAVLAGESLHGYAIVQRLGNLPMFDGQPPDTTGVYRMLRDMESRGLVTAEWAPPRLGPSRRRYALTATGRACLRRWIGTLHAYMGAISDLTGTVARASATGPAPARRPTAARDRRKSSPKAKA